MVEIIEAGGERHGGWMRQEKSCVGSGTLQAGMGGYSRHLGIMTEIGQDSGGQVPLWWRRYGQGGLCQGRML